MQIPKTYFHDRAVLFLLTVNTFIVVASSLAIILRLTGGNAVHYGQYRSNQGLNGYIPGDNSVFVQFIVFSILVLAFHTVLSVRVYPIHRHFSRSILALGLLLLLITAIVSNALLGLH